MFEISIEIHEDELEPLYHHVHHATALRYLERARLAYLESIGFPTEDLIAEDLYLVIASIDVQYLREIRGGPIRVTCENPRIESKSLLISQQIFNEKNKRAVQAEVHSKAMSGTTKRAVLPPAEFIEAFTQD